MQVNNIKKYYGFAKKSGAIAIGVDKICTSKAVYLIVASDELAKNAKNRLIRRSESFKCNMVLLSTEEFKQIEPNSRIMAVAIKSEELAKAMQK